MDKESKENSFSKNISDSFKEGTKPKFLGGNTEGGDAPSGTKAKKSADAAAGLKSTEESAASSDLKQTEDSPAGARKNEERASGFFTGEGRANTQGDDDAAKNAFLSRIKKGGPIVSIVLLIFAIGALMGSVQSYQLISWVANTNLNFNQSSAVLNLRANFIMRKALSSDPGHTSVTRTGIFRGERYKLGPEITEKLKANNIDIVETDGVDGKSLKMLVWTDQDGTKIPIVVSDNDVGRIPSSYSTDTGEVTLSKGMTLDTAKTSLERFKVDLDTATVAATGRIAGMFDSLADAYLRRIGGSDVRNKTRKITNTSSDEEIEEVLYKNISDGADDSDTSKVEVEEEDENGEKIKKPVTDADYTEGNDGGDDALKVGGANSTESVKSKLKTTAKKAAVGGSIACMVLKGIGAINAVVSGLQVANIINYTLTIYEASDKVRAGDGNNGFNMIANSLNKPTKSIAYDSNGNEVILTKATTSSAGWNNAFSSKNIVSEDDYGAMMVNREAATKNALRSTDFSGIADWGQLFGTTATSIAAYSICNGIQLALGVADFASDIVLFFTTAGIGTAVKKFFGGVIQGAKAALAVGALGVAIGIIAPMVGPWLNSNLKDILHGEVGGYALDSGAHLIHDGNLQMSAGMNMNKEQAVELYAMTREVEKEWAAYDRATLSPFDISSKYTFMGSLAYSLIPFINSSYSVPSSISSSVGVLNNSIASLTGESVNASNAINTFKMSLSSDENCASLVGSMKLAGDQYCNKYSGAYINDLETMDSYEIFDKVKDNFDGVDSEGNPILKANSEAAKYLIACNTNDAQPGTMSAVVQGYITKAFDTGSVVGNALVGFASNFVPGEGAIDAFQAIEEQNNIKWNSQSVCSDPEYRYISDYFVDQRALESLGIITKSSVATFLDNYYEENPIDNSYEGIIARYSGLSKEEVEDTLALIEYVNYIANYHPEERYAFGAPAVKGNNELKFDNEYQLSSAPILLDQITYADVRNRSYAV